MMSPDMSGVDPLRWSEVRDRVSVIVSFLKIGTPTEADRLSHAARLGLGRTQFLKLVRAWKVHGTAVSIAGARPGHRKVRVGWRALPAASERIMRETLEHLGPEVGPTAATAAVIEAVARAGLRTPDRSTVWRRLMATRRDRRPTEGESGVVIAECRIRLPVIVGGTLSMPSLLLAARAFDGRIVAALPLQGETPDFGALAAAVACEARSGGGTVDRDFAEHLGDVAGKLRVVAPGVARSALSRIIGRTVERLELQFNRTSTPAGRLLRTREDRPLHPADARLVLEDAIARHNFGRGGSGVFHLV